MLTGELRNQIEGIWNDFRAGGLANPLQVIEQVTYLIFVKRVDEMWNWMNAKQLRWVSQLSGSSTLAATTNEASPILEFLDLVIDHLTARGVMNPKLLCASSVHGFRPQWC